MIAIESMEDVHLYNAMRMLYNHFVERLSIGAQYGFDQTKVRKDVTELIKNKPVEMFEILEDMIAELDSRYKLGSRSLHPATSSVFDKIKFQVECFRKQYDVKSHIEVFVNPLPPPPERPRINTDETYARLKSEVTKHLANRFKNTITPPDAEVSVKNNLTKKEKKISAKQLKGKSRMHYLEIVTEDII